MFSKANPPANENSRLPDQIADTWAAVLVDIHQELTEREQVMNQMDQYASPVRTRHH